MKLNTKGFTLIELLAVIVILAIIALIATPIVLGILNDARKSAAADSTYGVIKAAELHFTKSLLTDNPVAAGTELKDQITYSGTQAETSTSSSIIVDAEGIVTVKNLKFNGFYCKGGSNEAVTCQTTEYSS